MNTDVAAQKAFDRLTRVGFDELSDSEKILAAVWTFLSEVANGGFVRYFSSAAGDMAYFVPVALKTIGSVEIATIASEANKVFGTEGPPKDRKERKAQVQAFGDGIRTALTTLESQFYESEEDTDELLDQYLNRKP